MAMSKVHKRTLDRTLEVLTEEMDVIPAMIHMKSKEIIQDIDEEKINAIRTDKEKIVLFVNIIKKRGKNAYQILKEYFENCSGSKHLAEELETNRKYVEEVFQGQMISHPSSRLPVEIWNEYKKKFYYFNCVHESIDLYDQIPEKINLLLLGKTGSGKSATGNTIVGEPYFMANGNSVSVTKTIAMKDVQEDRFNITVADTPGFFDTDIDFQDENTMHEVAKTVITLKGGVHLFLIHCNSTVRFTNEERETLDKIEKLLTSSVYKHCVLILSNAYARFGTKDKISLQEHVEEELRRGGDFANLLRRVNCRILAVENCFEDDFLTEKQRQYFLCCLAQVIQENNGSVYSNEAFENAKKRLELQEAQRKKRIEREKELTTMRNILRKFLVENYLNGLSESELRHIDASFEKNTLIIMRKSGVKQLCCIKAQDVKVYLSCFIQEHDALIKKLRDLKIQEMKQQEEYEQREEQLRKKEDTNQMQSIALPLVGNQLRQLSAKELEKIIDTKTLPEGMMELVVSGVKSFNSNIRKEQVEQFIEQTLLENPIEMKRLIDDKLLIESLSAKAKELDIVKRDLQVNATREILKTHLHEVLEQKTDEEIHQLHSDLQNTNCSYKKNWSPLLESLVGDELQTSNENGDEILHLCLDQNFCFLQSALETTIEKRALQKESRERQEREKIRNESFGKISEEIEETLKNYLREKTSNDLEKLNQMVERSEIPQDIIDSLGEYLTVEQRQMLSDVDIRNEILKQTKENSAIIGDCKKEAACFPGLTKVLCKDRGICNISDVKVGDSLLTYGRNGRCSYDKVYLLSHAARDIQVNFSTLQTSSGIHLSVSGDHLLPVDNLCKNVPAKTISVGDVIFTLQDGVMKEDTVVAISRKTLQGLYCPMTMTGTIVVNDVAASCYTACIPSLVAHVLLSPIRMLFNYLPLHVFNKVLPYDDEEGMPFLLLKCRSVITMLR